MTEKVLYVYKREDGGTTVSPIMPDTPNYTLGYRLIADEGKTLTDGKINTPCVDVSAANKAMWTEINAPEESETTEAV